MRIHLLEKLIDKGLDPADESIFQTTSADRRMIEQNGDDLAPAKVIGLAMT